MNRLGIGTQGYKRAAASVIQCRGLAQTNKNAPTRQFFSFRPHAATSVFVGKIIEWPLHFENRTTGLLNLD
ncbi:hypothetical protein QF025_000114 [Paraburkholderia graminis]|uniref:Uncharacterized protein n=1 Tax=Paraburkholderia graminis TaxID=60548 RepID=A0ABD5C819_9BURK|nr:hypothetical protein [Paraburkholderia graminis]